MKAWQLGEQHPAHRDLLLESIRASRVPTPRPWIQPTSRCCLTPLLHSGRIQETLAKPLSSVSPMYERMGMELAVGLNTWLNEYDVSLEL